MKILCFLPQTPTPRASPSPSTIISSSFSTLYFLSFHTLCAMLGVYRSLLSSLFCLLFITSWTLAYIVWERNTLHSTLEHNIVFMLIFVDCSLSFSSCYRV